MKKEIKLVKIDKEYCNYLREFDDKVPYNYAKKELRPFVGVLFQVNDCMYFAPLSSPKPKHLKLKAKIDFLKLDDGKLGAINFNNMLPVTEKNIEKIDFKEIDKKYKVLLKKQLRWLNRNDEVLYSKSERLYNKYIDGSLNEEIAKRCCNFKLLEEKCLDYNLQVQ